LFFIDAVVFIDAGFLIDAGVFGDAKETRNWLILNRKGLMGWVCLSVCPDVGHASTAALGKPYV
jgi:hypothetical protein